MCANIVRTPTVIPLSLPCYYKGRSCVTPATRIEISCDTPGARIFYTVNGRPPDPLGAWQMYDVTWPYDGPFTLRSDGGDGASHGRSRTVRALATDSTITKRSAIVTRIFHLLPPDQDQMDQESEDPLPARRRDDPLAARTHKQKTATNYFRSTISTTDAPCESQESLKTMESFAETLPRPRFLSKWKRLSSMKWQRHLSIDKNVARNLLDAPDIVVPENKNSNFVSDDIDVRLRPKEMLEPTILTDDQRVVDENVERFVNERNKSDDSLEKQSDDEVDIEFDMMEVPEHLLDSETRQFPEVEFENEKRSDHEDDDDANNDKDRKSSLDLEVISDVELSNRHRKQKGHVRFASKVDSREFDIDYETELSLVSKKEFQTTAYVLRDDDNNSQMSNQSVYIAVVSRESQTDDEPEISQLEILKHIADTTDRGVQCEIEPDCDNGTSEAVCQSRDIEYSDQGSQTPVIDENSKSWAETQTEDTTEHEICSSDALTKATELPMALPVETVSVGVGDSVVSESKSCQTLSISSQCETLLDKAVQTESRFVFVFDRAQWPTNLRVSPGRGFWRQQIDHLTKELKSQAYNNLEFRAMISEPRMTTIKRVIVHEGLDEMVLVVNVGLRYHPDWCCK